MVNKRKMVHTKSDQLEYFTNSKNQNKRFFCQPALSLFEHFIVYQTIPHERCDIVNSLDKYFHKDMPEKSETQGFTPSLFKVVEASWATEHGEEEDDCSRKTEFPSLNEYELAYYDIWQLNFINTLLRHQVDVSQYLAILRQVTCLKLTKLYDHKSTLEGALKILKRHASISTACHNLVGIRQNEFLFFKDYVKAVTANVDNQNRIELIPNNMYKTTLHQQIEAGLCLATKQWIHEKSMQGMRWNKIMEFIDCKENFISTTIIKERELKYQISKVQVPTQESEDSYVKIETSTQEIKDDIPETSKPISKDTPPTETGMYCTHHRINTHDSIDCYALNSRAKKPQAPPESTFSKPQKSITWTSTQRPVLSGTFPAQQNDEDIGIPHARGVINGVSVLFMLNAGVDVNIMTTTAQSLLNLPDLFDGKGKRTIQSVTGPVELSSMYTQAFIQLSIYSQCQSTQKFMLYPSKEIRITLGLPWIRSNYTIYLLHLIPQEKRREVISSLLKHQISMI
ncbi:hypothetical protein NEPAR03_1931 [Nematocida parisii]|nr:hypothetical protein NEPAR03_1931 [Nematocida parisii]